jgi:hypothetical protein
VLPDEIVSVSAQIRLDDLPFTATEILSFDQYGFLKRMVASTGFVALNKRSVEFAEGKLVSGDDQPFLFQLI